MFDFVQPVRAGRDFGPSGRDAGFEHGFAHAANISVDAKNANQAALVSWTVVCGSLFFSWVWFPSNICVERTLCPVRNR